MISNLHRVRPTRTTLAALLGLLWALSAGALRDFVWEDLRGGMMSFQGLSRLTRALIWLGFILLFLMVAALLFNDFWRAQFRLLTISAGAPRRGELLPYVLMPVTFFLLSMAWSFMLTGALHIHPAGRLAVLLVYVLFAAHWTAGSLAATRIGVGGPLEPVLAWAMVAAVPLVFLLRWRGQPRAGVEFALLLALVAATFVPAQARLYAIGLQTGVDVLQTFMGNTIVTLAAFAMPLLFMLGIDIVDFVYRASSRETEAAASRLPGAALYAVLAIVLGWRLRDVIREMLATLDGRELASVLPGYAGALGFPLLTFFVWWLVTRGKAGNGSIEFNSEEAAVGMRGYAALLIVAFHATSLLTGVLAMLVLAVNAAGLETPIDFGQIQRGANLLIQQELLWLRLVAAVTLLAAFWLARRGRTFAAVYLGVVGVRFVWNELTSPGQALEFLVWQGLGPVDFWWVILFAGVALFWLVRRELTPARAARLVVVVLMSGLLRQTSFIENPFSPLLGSFGIAFVAFAIVWDALTSGSWANTGTPGLPRASRIFLYLGYVLFTVTLLNWFLTVHSLSYVETFTGGGALAGLNLVGRPLLFALFVVLLTQRDEAVGVGESSEAVAGSIAGTTER